MSSAVRLNPAEERLVTALTARGLTLADVLTRPVLETIAAEWDCSLANVRKQVCTTRHALRESGALPKPPSGPGALTLREEALVDELEALGYAVAEALPVGVVGELAERLEITPNAVRQFLHGVRQKWNVKPGMVRGVGGYIQASALPEAPTLPLGCTDAAVVARCQREGLRLAETDAGRWRGW